MTVWNRCGALDGSVCDCGDCCNGSLGYRNDEDPGDRGDCPGGKFLPKMTFWEGCGVFGSSD